MPEDMKELFQSSHVPAPRADLADRIVMAARDLPPIEAANDRKPWIWTASAGIAATLLAGLFVIGTQPTEAELWAEQADMAGFGELYEWVEGEAQ